MKIEILYGADDELECLYYNVYHSERKSFLMLDATAILISRKWTYMN